MRSALRTGGPFEGACGTLPTTQVATFAESRPITTSRSLVLQVAQLAVCAALIAGPALAALGAQAVPPQGAALQVPDIQGMAPTLQELSLTLTRVPLAGALGAVLALRPRRRGTPPRTPAVVETQIVLAAVGALIMLIVGSSLARAFGIVGAANLIRYRSKIDDPKDAVVMLCALAVGLASGVGLYMLGAVSTLLLLALLWIIESFEPRVYKYFELTVMAKSEAEALRPKIEEVLRRFRLSFEGRMLSGDELCYEVRMPLDEPTDPVSHSIVALAPGADLSVAWAEKKSKTK